MTEVHGTSADGRGRQTSDSNKQARERHVFTATWPISPNVIPGNRKRQRVFKKKTPKKTTCAVALVTPCGRTGTTASADLYRAVYCCMQNTVLAKQKMGGKKAKKAKKEK